MLKTKKILMAIPSPEDLVDYANSLLLINKYAYAISTQTVPNLSKPPERYSDYIKQFSTAQLNPAQWSQTQFGKMVSVPNSILIYTNPFDTLTGYLQTLAANPNDANAKKNLKSAFQNIKDIFNIENDNINDILNFLEEFSNSIVTDSNTLTNLSNQALELAEGDTIKINNLNADILNLKQQITADEHLLTLNDIIGKSLNTFLNLIGIDCGDITDILLNEINQILNITNFGTSDSIGAQLLNGDVIQMQKQITQDYATIDEINRDVALLTNFSAQFNSLNTTVLDRQNSLTKILNMWQNLSQAITDALNELNINEWKDLQSKDYNQAIEDMAEIETNWGTLVDFAKNLSNIVFKWQDINGIWNIFGIANPGQNDSKINKIQIN